MILENYLGQEEKNLVLLQAEKEDVVGLMGS